MLKLPQGTVDYAAALRTASLSGRHILQPGKLEESIGKGFIGVLM